MDHKINLLETIVSHITIETSPYKTNTFIIYFKHPVTQQNINDFKKICVVYSAIEGKYAREMSDKLLEHHYISAEDRADIEDNIRQIEININYEDKTVDLLGHAQGEIIQDLALTYLEEILSLSNDHQQIFTLIQYTMSLNFKWEILNIIQLISSCSKTESQTTLECLKHLNRIFWGTANLESTYERLGYQVPSLKIQRETLADLSLRTLMANFKLSLEDQFYYAVELIMMTCVIQRHITPGLTRNFVKRILKGSAESRDIFYAFTHLGGFDNVLYQAGHKINLSRRETKELLESISVGL